MRAFKFAAALFAATMFSGAAAAAPVFTDLNSATATDMVNSLLSGGSGITINSVSYTGSKRASGLFNNGNSSNIGINSGIVLSSGILSEMPNSFDDNNGAAGNPLLEGYNGGTNTNNASTLEISFTPQGNQITFSYVFSSREYPNYVTSEFNDVFVFLVNGENRALIPGTDTTVSINTVNCGDENGIGATNCDLFRDNRNGDLTDLDVGGFTQVFNIVANVNPGEINRLVLSIGDTSDSGFDSAVFIQGGSLTVCGGPNQPPCDPDPVSEPGMIAMLGLGMLGVGYMRRRRRAA